MNKAITWPMVSIDPQNERVDAAKAAVLQTEKSILKKSQTHPEEFGKLFDLYFDRIYAYIYKRTSSRTVAEDIASNTFEKAFKARGRFRFQGLSVVAWLYRIASNNIIDYYRKHKIAEVEIEKVPHLVGREESVTETISKAQDLRLIKKAMTKLSDEDQELLTLKFMEDLGNNEIAKVVGVRAGNVAVKIYRALKKLRQIINNA